MNIDTRENCFKIEKSSGSAVSVVFCDCTSPKRFNFILLLLFKIQFLLTNNKQTNKQTKNISDGEFKGFSQEFQLTKWRRTAQQL